MSRSYLWPLCLFSLQVNKILNEVVKNKDGIEDMSL